MNNKATAPKSQPSASSMAANPKPSKLSAAFSQATGDASIPEVVGLNVKSCYIGDQFSAPYRSPSDVGKINLSPDQSRSPGTGRWPFDIQGPNRFWGVMKRTNAETHVPEYSIESPETLAILLRPHGLAIKGETLLARCETPEQAQMLVEALALSAAHKEDEGRVLIQLEHFNQVVKSLAGRILTLVDAALTTEIQRVAVVSLVKKEVRQTLSDMFRYVVADKGKSEQSAGPEVDVNE